MAYIPTPVAKAILDTDPSRERFHRVRRILSVLQEPDEGMLWAVDADPGAPELEGHAAMLVIIYWGEEGIDEIAPHLAAAGTRATDEPHKLRIPADSLDEIIAILTDLRLAFEPEIYVDEYIISPLSSDYVASADSRYSDNVECRMHIDPDALAVNL